MPNDFDFRPITFEEQTFPTSLMAISILVPAVEPFDSRTAEWLWRLSICCGFPKSAQAEQCVASGRLALAFLSENRDQVLQLIREGLGLHGFDPEITYREWVLALNKIVEISSRTEGCCHWIAPSHPEDPIKSISEIKQILAQARTEAGGG